MEEVILRAAQLANKSAVLKANMSIYSWRGEVSKEKKRELRAVTLEYEMLLDIIHSASKL